jgi:hypothetical protein
VFESGAACAEQGDEFLLNDADQATVRAVPSGEFRDASDLVHLAAARGGDALAAPRPDDEFADYESDHEENDHCFDIVAAIDRE